MKARALLVMEDGFAMVTVIGVMVVSLAFASAAALASISSLRGTVRDEDSKTALAAADAGASAALVRQNTVAGTGSNSCLASGPGGVLVSASLGSDGWCPPVTGSIDRATYSYQVAPASDGTLRVVSVGASDGVNRRIELSAHNASGSNVFSDASLIGLDHVHMDSNARVNAGTASNGSISLDSNSVLCGPASVGIGQSLHLNSNAQHGGAACPESSYPVTEAPVALPPVQQGDVVTNNSNDRFFGQDLIGGKAKKVSWDPITRRLELKSNVSLTLGGSNYSLCSLKLGSNSKLYIAAGASVRIFFDRPEACLFEQVPLDIASNAKLIATGGGATNVAMLFVGSDTVSSQITLNSNSQLVGDCSSEFVIYAPKTDINIDSNVTYCGALAGKSVELDSNTQIDAGGGVNSFELPGAGPHYVADRFVECTVPGPGTAGAGC